jgi:hypothetical protein
LTAAFDRHAAALTTPANTTTHTFAPSAINPPTPPSSSFRYIVSHGPSAVYVAFQGTKHLADWAVNLRFRHANLWQRDGKQVGSFLPGRRQALLCHAAARPCRKTHFFTSQPQLPPALEPPPKPPQSWAAHSGFSRRSMAIPLLELRDAARAAGKRLVLCGHSLGGAVAMLSAVTLLRSSARGRTSSGGGSSSGGGAAVAAEDPQIRCVTFAAPPVANEALAAEVAAAGWDRYISNFVLPEDPVVPLVNKLLRATSDGGLAALGLGGDEAAAVAAAAAAVADKSAELPGGGPIDGETAARSTADALGRAAAAAAAAFAVTQLLLPLHLELLEQAEAEAWGCQEDEGAGDPQFGLPPHGAAAALVTSAAGPAALGGPGRARGARALQLHGRRAFRLIRWAHDPRVAGHMRQSHQHQRQRPQGAPQWQPRPQQGQQLGRPQLLDPRWAGVLTLPHPATAIAAVVVGAPGWSALSKTAGSLPRIAAPSATLSTSSPRNSSGGGACGSGHGAHPAAAAGAWARRALSGGLRAGLRAAGPVLSRLVPIDFLSSAIIAAVVPRTCPIGAQWVLTHGGPERQRRANTSYPQQPDGLGLEDLGGLFPGHRMVAYRNRVAHVCGGEAAAVAGAAAEASAVEEVVEPARRGSRNSSGGGGGSGPAGGSGGSGSEPQIGFGGRLAVV